MIPLLLLHLLAAVVCLVPGTRLGRRMFAVAAVAPAATFVWLLTVAGGVVGGTPEVAEATWVPQLGLTLQFRLDGFALLMALLVSGIGTLVMGYSLSYFRPHGEHPARDDCARLAGLLVAFAGAMLGLVLADGFFTLFLFWELTSVTSYLLIGIDDRVAAARAAAQRAFLVTGAGGLALLGGLVLLGQRSGTTTISGLLADPPTGTVVTVALVLVLAGAFAKSAQFPLHFWLPGAMAAPTPVSAFLHSATMVKAGIYLVARLSPVFAEVGPWRLLVVVCGGGSLLLGGVRALREQDAKLSLAHGTVSQLGLIMILVGLGTPATTYAGVAVLTAHALFKASLFLTIGVVDHEAGTRDLRRLRGLGRRLPVLAAVGITAGASMAAIPPTLGFVAKEAGIAALEDTGIGVLGPVALVLVVAGSVLTVAYTLRTVGGLFGRDVPAGEQGPAPVDPAGVHRPSAAFVAAPAVLAALSLLGGLAAAPVGAWLAEVAGSLTPAAADGYLALWPGLHLALALSVTTWVLGTALAEVVRRRERGGEPAPTFAIRAYAATYDGLLRGSRRLTAVTQSGSLPAYLTVVLTTLVIALGAAWLQGVGPLGDVPWAESWLQVVAAVLTGGLALAMVRARRRFTAAVLLGGSGYGLALIFLLHGAPDLAITQFLIDTLSIVLFLLVMSRLPDRFRPPPSWVPNGLRLGLAVLVGVAVAGFSLAASAARTEPSVGEEYVQRSEPEAGGRNVVNVTIVDFRGFDTLGEITVLGVAAVGVVNLVTAARRRRRGRHDGTGVDPDGNDSNGAAAPAPAAEGAP
ncbi:MAG: hydrogen gas-evolving membrane-bound hydrogenase subunit E [Microthrixaceae bacterium]